MNREIKIEMEDIITADKAAVQAQGKVKIVKYFLAFPVLAIYFLFFPEKQ